LDLKLILLKPIRTTVSVLLVAGLLSLFLYQFGDFDLKGCIFIGIFTVLLIFMLPKIELYWKKRKDKNIS